MRLGTSIPKYYQPSEKNPYAKTYELARLTEEAGFDYGSVPHHSFTPETEDYAAPLIMMAALAARTTSLRIASTIFILPLYHPVAVAEQLAELDRIAGGRIIFGTAIGYRPYEFDGHGVDIHTRGKRMDECLQIIRDGFSSGKFSFEGKFFKIPESTVAPMPVQKPFPPMWIGGTSDAALRRAARLGDGWISENLLMQPAIQERIAVYRGFSAAAGRPPGEVCVVRNASVAASRAAVEAEWLPGMIAYHLFNRENYRKAGMDMPDPDGIYARLEAGQSVGLNEFARQRVIAGTPDDCIAQIKSWEAETGCDYLHLILNTQVGNEAEYEAHKKMLVLFRDEIIPAL